jgi:hypothetical protein
MSYGAAAALYCCTIPLGETNDPSLVRSWEVGRRAGWTAFLMTAGDRTRSFTAVANGTLMARLLGTVSLGSLGRMQSAADDTATAERDYLRRKWRCPCREPHPPWWGVGMRGVRKATRRNRLSGCSRAVALGRLTVVAT